MAPPQRPPARATTGQGRQRTPLRYRRRGRRPCIGWRRSRAWMASLCSAAKSTFVDCPHPNENTWGKRTTNMCCTAAFQAALRPQAPFYCGKRPTQSSCLLIKALLTIERWPRQIMAICIVVNGDSASGIELVAKQDGKLDGRSNEYVYVLNSMLFAQSVYILPDLLGFCHSICRAFHTTSSWTFCFELYTVSG